MKVNLFSSIVISVLFSISAWLVFGQPALTKITKAQISTVGVAASSFSITEQITNVGPINSSFTIGLPVGGCSYQQIFLNGLNQSSPGDFSINNGSVVFNNGIVAQGDLVKVVCFK